MFYVYIYSKPDGTPFYVGKGCGKRYIKHLNDAKSNRHSDSYNIRTIRKLLSMGESPIIEKVIENIDEELAFFIEEALISKYGRKDLGTGILVNQTAGGDGIRQVSKEVLKKQTAKFIKWSKEERVVDSEYRSKISEGLKQHYIDNPVTDEKKQHLSKLFKGSGNPFYGKTHTQQTIEKVVQGSLGRVHSSEEKEKRNRAIALNRKLYGNPFQGKKHTEESLLKMSLASKAHSDALKEQGKEHWNKGRCMTEDTKQKLRIHYTCPHCGKEGCGSAMRRYHLDNCKHREVA